MNGEKCISRHTFLRFSLKPCFFLKVPVSTRPIKIGRTCVSPRTHDARITTRTGFTRRGRGRSFSYFEIISYGVNLYCKWNVIFFRINDFWVSFSFWINFPLLKLKFYTPDRRAVGGLIGRPKGRYVQVQAQDHPKVSTFGAKNEIGVVLVFPL